VNFRLGVMYFYGWNTSKDMETGTTYLQTAYNQLFDNNDPDSQCDLGYMHECGLIVPKDASIASKYYQIAADAGSARGQFNIAHMYHYGQGVPTDVYTAFTYYKLSAEQGYVKALYMLGHMHQYGIGITVDKLYALQYYKLASEKGHPRASYIVGYFYKLGDGVEADLNSAIKYFRIALDLGYARGGFDLAQIYEEKNDFKNAILCQLIASQQKEGKESQEYLVNMFQGKLGIKKKLEAVYYLSEEWQNSEIYFLLDENCQTAIREIVLLFKKIPLELIFLIIKSLIFVWPESHFIKNYCNT